MKFSVAALLASASLIAASCTNDGGNWYCAQTNKVIFKNIGFSGSYKEVVSMDEASGSCSQQPKAFSGPLSPLDEELSVHFRGPLRLVQFGVYYPSLANHKREEDCATTRQHQHHKHKRATKVVEVVQTVVVDGEGHTVTSSVAKSSDVANVANDNVVASVASGVASAVSSAIAPVASASASGSVSGSASGWTRSSYYTPGTGSNVTFLNNHGGSNSGVWSSKFGNSLSYCNKDASDGSASAVLLDDVTLKSNQEFVIFSGSKCAEGDSACGYYRDGIPAYHGFSGSSKMFVFEFGMPSDSGNTGFNGDMPAVWLLNAKIPRTLQYGNIECSCWATGCGELDLFEILSSGSTKMISTLHDGQGATNGQGGGAGSSDYFERPTSGTFKGAAIFSGNQVHVIQLDDSVVFGQNLDVDLVQDWISKSGSSALLA